MIAGPAFAAAARGERETIAPFVRSEALAAARRAAHPSRRFCCRRTPRRSLRRPEPAAALAAHLLSAVRRTSSFAARSCGVTMPDAARLAAVRRLQCVELASVAQLQAQRIELGARARTWLTRQPHRRDPRLAHGSATRDWCPPCPGWNEPAATPTSASSVREERRSMRARVARHRGVRRALFRHGDRVSAETRR